MISAHLETKIGVVRARKKDLRTHHSRILSIQEGKTFLDNSPPRHENICKVRQ